MKSNKRGGPEPTQRVREFARRVSLAEDALHQYPAELSVGRCLFVEEPCMTRMPDADDIGNHLVHCLKHRDAIDEEKAALDYFQRFQEEAEKLLSFGQQQIGDFAMGKLQDKTALITGASSGIGKKVALSFADEGADVAVNYPDDAQAENAAAVVAEVEKRGRRALAIRADVSKADENAAMVDQFLDAFGHIDILVNNAGIGRTAMVEEMSVEMWDEMIAVNLRSVFLTTHKVLPLMYAQGHGKIINTASQLAYKGAPGLAHYTASKAAIVSFTRSLSLEIGDRGVNVNCVAPGATTTPILDGMDEDILETIRQTIPRGRFAVVEEIAPTFVFLASSDADHYVGQCLSPNGGDIFL